MVRNIGRALAEIQQAMVRCRGDAHAEPRSTGTRMAHLLIDTAKAARADQRFGVTGRATSAGRARPRRRPRRGFRG